MKHVTALSAMILIAFGGAAQADLSSGSLTGAGGGITAAATGSWDSSETTISWDVTQNPDSTWHYRYTFEVPDKEPGLIIFQVSDNFTEADYLGPGTADLDTWGTQGNSTPGLPALLYGLKFELEEEEEELIKTVEFNSTRAPTWGNFYAKDGSEFVGEGPARHKIDVYAYNTDFLIPGSGGDRIAVPDTAVVPLPGAVLLGILGLVAAGRKLRRVC